MECSNCGNTVVIPAGRSFARCDCNAIQKRKAKKVDVREQAEDGTELGNEVPHQEDTFDE